MFETENDVLEWYEKQPRALSREFLNNINWKDIQNHELNKAFLPVLVYMRDVEMFTEIYYKELLRTPTGKDPVIRKFMDRWNTEEHEHGEILNRFLAEAGMPTNEHWEEEAKKNIPFRYTFESKIYPLITNCFGKSFSGTHMAWGAINEMTTLQGYRRLWTLAEHPILEQLLRAIAQEESLHSNFYWQIARIKLERSGFSRKIANFMVEKFWSPVGAGAKKEEDTNYVIKMLFKGKDGLEHFERNVNQRVRKLPGMEQLRAVRERIETIATTETPTELTAEA
ncbi:MAG: hypothetical protein NVSMB56_03310 [Pyrinomonadaceae bacterium]